MKKYLIVLILRMLETHSDKTNPLTQVKIAEEISKVYPCDRKTVGRNIKFLTEIKYPIIKTSKGFYMDKQLFRCEEIEYVIDSVKKNDVEISQKEELCDKLRSSLSRYYRR